MRSLVATALALLVAGHGHVVYADPSTPQISPLHGPREDAQCLREQLRGLDREAAPEPVVAPSPQPRTNVDPATSRALPRAPDKPLVQRWWFWAALGAVAVTLGATYGTTRSPPPHLPGVTCDATGCHL